MDDNNRPEASFMEQVAQRFGQVYFSYDTSSSTFSYLAPSLEQLCGIKPEDVTTPTDLLSCVHDDDREFLSHQYQKLMVGQEEIQAEFRIVQADQSIRWIGLSACFLRNQRSGQHLIGGTRRT